MSVLLRLRRYKGSISQRFGIRLCFLTWQAIVAVVMSLDALEAQMNASGPRDDVSWTHILTLLAAALRHARPRVQVTHNKAIEHCEFGFRMRWFGLWSLVLI